MLPRIATGRQDTLRMGYCRRRGRRRLELTLVPFSAQLEPCLTPKNTLNTPQHPLNMGYTIPARTPCPIKNAQVELRCGRV